MFVVCVLKTYRFDDLSSNEKQMSPYVYRIGDHPSMLDTTMHRID